TPSAHSLLATESGEDVGRLFALPPLTSSPRARPLRLVPYVPETVGPHRHARRRTPRSALPEIDLPARRLVVVGSAWCTNSEVQRKPFEDVWHWPLRDERGELVRNRGHEEPGGAA